MSDQREGLDDLTVAVGVTVVSGAEAASTHRPPSNAFVPGAILAGRYRLVALLGRGGMGEV